MNEKISRSRDKKNLIRATLTDAAMQGIEAGLNTARGFMPFLVMLSTEERNETLRPGDNMLAGALELIPLIREYVDYIPPAIADPDKMEGDAALDERLAKIEAWLTELLRMVQDARLRARSDLARHALAAYSMSHLIPNELGAAARLEKLKRHFSTR